MKTVRITRPPDELAGAVILPDSKISVEGAVDDAREKAGEVLELEDGKGRVGGLLPGAPDPANQNGKVDKTIFISLTHESGRAGFRSPSIKVADSEVGEEDRETHRMPGKESLFDVILRQFKERMGIK